MTKLLIQILLMLLLIPMGAFVAEAATVSDRLSRESEDMPLLSPPPWHLVDLIPLPEEGRGIQVFDNWPDTRLIEFDLETYRKTREADIENFTYQNNPSRRQYDFVDKRVWSVGGNPEGTQVFELNLDTLQVTRVWSDPLRLWRGVAWASTLRGFDVYLPPNGDPPKFYFQWTRIFLLSTGDSLVGANTLAVSQVNSSNPDGEGADWVVPIRACAQANMELPGAVFRSRVEDAVYVFCKTGNHAAQVVRLSLGEGGDPYLTASGQPSQPVEAAFPGPASLAYLPYSDPDGNRMFVNAGDALWVFDGSSSGYVGVIGLRGPNPLVERRSGRIYLFNSGHEDSSGIYITDGRSTPPAQFEPYQQFKLSGRIVGAYAPNKDRPGRIYLLPEESRSAWVIRDARPVTGSVNRLNDSERTEDVAEKEGATEVDYSGASKGYGLRALLVSGPEGLLPGTTAADIALTRRPLRVVGSPCTRSNREVSLGRVRQAELSTLVTSASSRSADADATTKADLGSPTQSCWPATVAIQPDTEGADNQLGRNWEAHYPEMACGSSRTQWQHQNFRSTAAEVECDHSVTATARHGFDNTQFMNLPYGAVTASEAGSQTTITNDESKGILTTTISWARGVTIAGVGAIDEVYAEAQSWAKGRPGTNGTSYEARVCGYQEIGKPKGPMCEDPSVIAPRVAQALGSRGTAKGPQIDEELAQGSPRGYQAAIQKDLLAHLSSRALNSDESTEAAALEIIVWDDSSDTGRARQIYQLAGLEASSQYGISTLPQALDELVEVDPGAQEEFSANFEESLGEISEIEPLVESEVDESPVGPQLHKTLERILRGFAFAFKAPGIALAIWSALALPVYLALRRRALTSSLQGLA